VLLTSCAYLTARRTSHLLSISTHLHQAFFDEVARIDQIEPFSGIPLPEAMGRVAEIASRYNMHFVLPEEKDTDQRLVHHFRDWYTSHGSGALSAPLTLTDIERFCAPANFFQAVFELLQLVRGKLREDIFHSRRVLSKNRNDEFLTVRG